MTETHMIRDRKIQANLGPIYESLLGSMGTEEFGPTARDALQSVTAGVDRFYLFEFQGLESSKLQYWSVEPGLAEIFPVYVKCYLPHDPILEAFKATRATSEIAYQRVRPADIGPTTFRRRVFDSGGIVERVSIVQRGTNGWRIMNVSRHEKKGCFSGQEIEGLIGLASLILPMLPHAMGHSGGTRQLSTGQLEARFAARCKELTRREREVCARAAVGMTVEATALELGIAKSSILTYRKRAYQRLNVTSPYELCSLVSH